MRISDWSSDVRSSDLRVACSTAREQGLEGFACFVHGALGEQRCCFPDLRPDAFRRLAKIIYGCCFALCGPPVLPDGGHDDIDMRLCAARDGRSEEHTSEVQSLMRISYAGL